MCNGYIQKCPTTVCNQLLFLLTSEIKLKVCLRAYTIFQIIQRLFQYLEYYNVSCYQVKVTTMFLCICFLYVKKHSCYLYLVFICENFEIQVFYVSIYVTSWYIAMVCLEKYLTLCYVIMISH